VPLDGAAGIDGDAEPVALAADVAAADALAAADELLLDELEHAAASSAIGTRAVAL
jgi:hypothetical protein